MKIYFDIEADLLHRRSVRQMLDNSKAKILHWYPNSRVLITENKTLFESKFYFEADNLPNSAELEMRNWLAKIKTYANEI